MSALDKYKRAHEKVTERLQKLKAQKEVLEAEDAREAKRRTEMGFATWKALGVSVEADKKERGSMIPILDEKLGPFLEGNRDG